MLLLQQFWVKNQNRQEIAAISKTPAHKNHGKPKKKVAHKKQKNKYMGKHEQTQDGANWGGVSKWVTWTGLSWVKWVMGISESTHLYPFN